MKAPPGGASALLWKRVAWLLAVVTLLAAVVAIYLFLRPEPRRLADPEEFSLGAGERFSLEGLPMGSRYRLRACASTSDLEVSVGTWRSGAVRLVSNPTDDRSRDLRIDGRGGGLLSIDARTPTGRLILFRDRAEVTCRGDDPRDLEFRTRQLSRSLPPFKCDDDALALLDSPALQALRGDLLSAGTLNRSGTTGSRAGSSAAAAPLSDEIRACQERLERLLMPPASLLPAAPVPIPGGAEPPTGASSSP